MLTPLPAICLIAAIIVPPLEPEKSMPEADASGPSLVQRALTPEDAATLSSASIEFQSGRYEETLKILEQAAAVSVPHPETLNLRGATLVELGRLQEAEQVFKWVLEIEPSHFWARYNLAEIALLSRRFDDAQRQFLALPVRSPGEEELVSLKVLLICLRSNEKDFARSHLPAWPPVSAAGYAAYAALAHAEGNPEKRSALIHEARSLHKEQFGPFLQKTLEESGIPLD